jgi:hypothetical protein
VGAARARTFHRSPTEIPVVNQKPISARGATIALARRKIATTATLRPRLINQYCEICGLKLVAGVNPVQLR